VNSEPLGRPASAPVARNDPGGSRILLSVEKIAVVQSLARSSLPSRVTNDQVKLEELVTRYERPLRRFLLGLVQDVELAADLCQDVLLTMCRRMPVQIADPGPWLYTVALNKARGALRRRRLVRWVRWLPGIHDQQIANATTDFELRHELRVVLTGLPVDQRACLILWADGFRYREIAEMLGCSIDAVRLRLFRARRVCRSALGDTDQRRPLHD
jgi:RNA polymerase sigma-70 factor (ECF subfamily)